MEKCDFFIIGGGSAGVRAARIASSLGAKVILAESQFLGGTCVNVGCVPKKIFSYCANFPTTVDLAKKYGWQASLGKLDWASFIENKNLEIKRLNAVYQQLLEKSKVKIIPDKASINEDKNIVVGDKVFDARYVLLAVGGKPRYLDIEGHDLAITSDQVFYLPKLPANMLIVGGGYIASELASIFNGFGSDITLSYRNDLLLKNFDIDLRKMASEALPKNGVSIKWQSQVQKLTKVDNKVKAWFDDGSTAEFDQVVMAVGRSPNFTGLGIENLLIQLDKKGKIIINEYYQSAEPRFFAVGDIASPLELTPVAIKEGQFVAKYLFDSQKPCPLDYNLVPKAVFSFPNLATVGLSEDLARQQNIPIKVYKSTFNPMYTSFVKQDHKFMIKMVVDKKTDHILGIHLFGDESPEMIQGYAVAMSLGAKKSDLSKLVGIHPTVAEEITTIN